MRISKWTIEQKAQPAELVEAIVERRGGKLIDLDRALLWSEPLARAWNVYLKGVRTELGVSRKLRELHQAAQEELESLKAYLERNNIDALQGMDEDEALVVRYAEQMTRNVQVDDAFFDEYHHHAPDFLAAGGAQEELESLKAYLERNNIDALQGMDEDEALVVRYAEQMTRNVQVDDAFFETLRQRFNTQDLVEITASIATYNMVARFLVALGITPEEEIR
ncbi:alkylhydroperoxidase family enzyme [Paraburkholderia youngii]|uniref:carboxymuconolactone decarboxylase family protein n=1 Tax=Paraburkholderia youngii TaxID=2782701 RepID=UPI003D1A726B